MSASSQNSNSLGTNTSYNPNESLLSFTSIYGDGTAVTFHFLQSLVDQRVNQGIVYGTRCGASIITLVIMWMISKNRRTPVFIINQVSLTLLLIQSALYFRYLLSGFGSVTYALTGFPQLTSSSDLHAYAASNIVLVLLIASIEASLIFQVKVIFTADNLKKLGILLTTVSVLLGLATVTMYFFTAIKLIVALYDDSDGTATTYYNVSLILLASSINFMTLILIVKLFLAIRSRRFLGLKQFDSFHILLIVSCQTLLAPSLLFILAYSLHKDQSTDVLIAIAVLIVVLSLPLSSLWATATNNFSSSTAVSSDFSPSSGSYYPKGSSSLCSESFDDRRKRSVRNQIYNLYPRSRMDGDDQSEKTFYGVADVEHNPYGEFYAPVGDDLNTLQPPNSSSSRRDANKETNTVVTIYTPNTVTEEREKGDVLGSSVGSTPTKKVASTREYGNISSHILRNGSKQEDGIMEIKKISLMR